MFIPNQREWMTILFCINAIEKHISNFYILKKDAEKEIFEKRKRKGKYHVYTTQGMMAQIICTMDAPFHPKCQF